MLPEKPLACGHNIFFGVSGTPGGPSDLSHQKDVEMVRSYNILFGEILPGFRPNRVLEIGVARGGSLAIWNDMFGCEVVGVDNNCGQVTKACRDHYSETGRMAVFHLQMPDVQMRAFGTFDMIVDDGGHGFDLVKDTFDIAWPMVSKGGIYVVEDWKQAFHDPLKIVSHFGMKMVENWGSHEAPPGTPRHTILLRGLIAMKKESEAGDR